MKDDPAAYFFLLAIMVALFVIAEQLAQVARRLKNIGHLLQRLADKKEGVD